MELKEPLSFQDQVKMLQAHGLCISDTAYAEKFLGRVNYYKFTGYTLQFRMGPSTSDLSGRHTFEEIAKLYDFDCELRQILRKYIECVEVFYKTQIANYFALEKCSQPPHNQHYDPANYFNKDGFNHLMETFSREQNYYADSLIVRHHKEFYDGKMPLWVMVELMSFSSLSKFYNAMYVSSQENISKHSGIGAKTLANHLHCLSVLRNKCSHTSRLMNVHYNPPARLSRAFLQNHPAISNSSLFAYILVLQWRLPLQEQKLQLKIEIIDLLDRYKDVLDLSLIGFPTIYKNLL